MSVTSSSQVSASRARPLIWGDGKENIKDGVGGPPEDPNDPSGGGSAGDGHRGPRGHRGQRGRTGPPGRDGAMGPMGPVGPRGFQEGMDHPPPGAHSLPRDWEYPLCLMLI